jgi:ABC-type nitrate/sulfonate/bicarbonate transport system ATPase subunit
MSLLRIESLGVTIRGEDVVDDVSLSVGAGETVGVVGESGSGKSMTALSVMQLPPEGARCRGRVEVQGRDVLTLPERALCGMRGKDMGMVFQEPTLLPWRSLRANLTIPLGIPVTAAEAALAEVGLGGRGADFPRQLSLGQQRRLALARAFAYPAPVLLLDEPFQNLDLAVKLELAAVVRRTTAGERRTTLMVTHDVVEALVTADRIIILGGEPARIVGERTVDLREAERDPRSTAAQRVAGELYALLLEAE